MRSACAYADCPVHHPPAGGFTPRAQGMVSRFLSWLHGSFINPDCITPDCHNPAMPNGALCIPCNKAQEIFRLVIKWQECQHVPAYSCGCNKDLVKVNVPRSPAGMP